MKDLQHDFPNMREGGVNGRLELFRKFIRFDVVTRALAHHINHGANAHDDDDDLDGFTTTCLCLPRPEQGWQPLIHICICICMIVPIG